MKRVAIITLYHKNYNFGGQLQAYALHNIISSYDFECQVVDLAPANKMRKIRIIGLRKTFTRFCDKVKLKFYCAIDRSMKAGMQKKIELFDKFMSEIPHTAEYNDSNIYMIEKDYDYWITGSDQVWNPEAFCLNQVYLLRGITHGIKISYAASHWDAQYTVAQKKLLRNCLRDFAALSAREEALAEIISECIHKPVATVLDPTLLLSSKQWDEIVVLPNVTQKYAFVYLIHPCNRTKKNIYRYCQDHNLKMVIVPHAQGWYKSADEKYYDIQAAAIGPREWIGYIKNAEIVFTDSFHGTVFSVIYHKKFWSFENLTGNEKNNSHFRKYSFLKKLVLDYRCVPYSFDLNQDFTDEPILYGNADKSLNLLKNYSMKYLNSALETGEMLND